MKNSTELLNMMSLTRLEEDISSATTVMDSMGDTRRKRDSVAMSRSTTGKSVRSRVWSTTKEFFQEPQRGTNLPWYIFYKHRYYRVFSFLAACLLTTVVYIGWAPMTTMFIRSGAYSWNCDARDTLSNIADEGCPAQQRFFQQLYYIGLASESIVGAVAGFSFDRLGPFMTALIGELMFITGWLLFTFSSQSFNAFVPGIVLLAGAANMVAFPTLILSDLFPRAGDWMTSVVVAAQCTSALVPTILLRVSDKYPDLTRQDLFLYYLYWVVLPCAILFLISVPLRRQEPQHQHGDSLEPSIQEELPIDDNECGIVSDERHPDIGISPSHIDPPLLLRQVLSLDYVLFAIFYILQQLQYTYYPTSLRDAKGTRVAQFLAVLLPAQGIIGPILGAVAQKTKTLPICAAICSVMSVAYCLTPVPNYYFPYIAVVLYVVANSYIFTARYTYISEVFPLTHFGALVGIMGAVSGVITLGAGFVPHPPYIFSCIMYCVCGIVALSLVFILMFRRRRALSSPTSAFFVRQISKSELATT